MAGHSTAEALAAAVLLTGYVLLVQRSGLPRGWPDAARRLRCLHLGPGLLAASVAVVGAASAAAVLGSAPAPAAAILLIAAAQLMLALRWLRRPRFATADGLVQAATAVACAWLVAWSGALPLTAHLVPGGDQLAVLAGEALLILWLTMGTRHPAVAPEAAGRVGWGRVGVTATTRPGVALALDGVARGRD